MMKALVGDPAKMFRVRVLADSIPVGRNGGGFTPGVTLRRLVTYQLTYPRVVLAELNTHRMLSRSSESSRALPAKRRRRQLASHPYRPLRWGQHKPGMGAGADLEDAEALAASDLWENLLTRSVEAVDAMRAAGAAKEDINRVTEPWALVSTVVTASEWDNFFALRCHDAAYAPFRFMARAMWVARHRSTPAPLYNGEWHLPYITDADREAARVYSRVVPAGADASALPFPSRLGGWQEYHLCRWSSARCARVSYGLPDGSVATPEKDDETWSKLAGNGDGKTLPRLYAWRHPKLIGPGDWPYVPVHASPMEHQGTPEDGTCVGRWAGNLPGWVQFRKLLGGENVSRFAPPQGVREEWEREIPQEVFTGPDLY